MRLSLLPGRRWKGNAQAAGLKRAQALRLAGLAAILLLAGWLRFADLQSLGYSNHYYAAAVASMLKSWHNFFYVAAEPGGSVSVDKPPLGFWLQAGSVAVFGVNSFGLLLPQILAGLLSIVVVERLVRRSFGGAAGLLAALALAVTPIAVATDRNNTIDSLLILTLLLAAWAFIKANESGKQRYLLLGAALVGIGFNIKMLQAYLVLPAFFGLYLLGGCEGLRRKLANLGLATFVLLAVSLAWALAVDLTPANQRPYVGSSADNSELSLIVGYNGLSRLLGMGGPHPGGPGSGGLNPDTVGAAQGAPEAWFGPAGGPGTNGPVSGSQPAGGLPAGGDAGMGTPGIYSSPPAGNFPPGGPAGGGFPGTGRPGALRLFIPPLSKEASWLLPFGLASLALLIFSGRWHWPAAAGHQALVLWGGWLLTAGVFFSVAGFFHEYYMVMLAPALAALVGSGASLLWRLYAHCPLVASLLLLGAAVGTLCYQALTALAFQPDLPWLPLAAVTLVIGALLLASSTMHTAWKRLAPAGFVITLTALQIVPGVWSGYTALQAGNQSLPSAYGGVGGFASNAGPGRPAGLDDGREPGTTHTGDGGAVTGGGMNDPGEDGRAENGLHIDTDLLAYLQAHTQGMEYLMAVSSAQEGADYVLASGRPVLYMGGFNGSDTVVTADDLARMVSQGKLRFIYLHAGEVGPNEQAEIANWVRSSCSVVSGYATDKAVRSPDLSENLTGRAGPGARQGGRLYDCRT